MGPKIFNKKNCTVAQFVKIISFLIICVSVTMTLLFVVFLNSSYGGDREWTSDKNPIGIHVNYRAYYPNYLDGCWYIWVFSNKIYIGKMFFNENTDIIKLRRFSMKVPSDLEWDDDEVQFWGNRSAVIITGKTAKQIVQSLKKGKSLDIKDLGYPDEPNFIVSPQGFNAAYKRVMKGQVDGN
jgi:hypothetical protein